MTQDEDTEGLSILDHLGELRQRLMISVAALFFGTIIGFFFAGYPLELLARPLVKAQEAVQATRDTPELGLIVAEDGTIRLRDPSVDIGSLGTSPPLVFYREGAEEPEGRFLGEKPGALFYRSPVDAVTIWLKASLVIGLILGLPVILYQIYAFVAPGLHPHEKRFIIPIIIVGSFLFPLGATFAYFLLEIALQLFSTFAVSTAVPINDAAAYLGFALMLMLAFGAVFEFPVVVVLATRMGLVETRFLAERRKYVFLGILIVSAIVTPPDVFTLAAMSIPLYFLFEISLLVSSFLDRLSARNEPEGPTNQSGTE